MGRRVTISQTKFVLPRLPETLCSTAKFMEPTEMLKIHSRGTPTVTSRGPCWAVLVAKTLFLVRDSIPACQIFQLLKKRRDSHQSWTDILRNLFSIQIKHSQRRKVQIWYSSRVWNLITKMRCMVYNQPLRKHSGKMTKNQSKLQKRI